jgi:hypothetical protein
LCRQSTTIDLKSPRSLTMPNNLSEGAAVLLLDWVLGGSTPTRPPGRWCGLSLGTPNSRFGSEVGPASGYQRQTVSFAPANSPALAASNNNAMTFGPFSFSNAIVGMQIWDTSAVAAGTMLWQGTLGVARTVLSGDDLVIAAGGLSCGLS